MGQAVTLDAVALDRCAGVLVGQAAGDALGAGYEFKTPPAGEPAMIGGGIGDWEPGEWTDDTQMALCIAQVSETGDLDVTAVGDRFLEWYWSGPADVGIQTRSVLGSATSGADLASVAADHFAAHPNGSAGNGSLMRTAPVALAHLGDDQSMAAAAMEVSSLTHADPVTGEACVLWCIAIDRAVRFGRLDGAWDGLALLDPDRRQFWEDRLLEAESRAPGSFNPNGYVMAAFQAAHAVVSQTPVPAVQSCRQLQAALFSAVLVGDDTDTVAAIAGSLLGARWGASAVPSAWRSMIHGRPGMDCSDLVRMAVKSARGGEDDGAGWPSGVSLLPYYEERFGPEGIVLGLGDDPGVWIGDVAGLGGLPHEVDVVVSLCRVGREDVPSGLEALPVWLMDEPQPSENPNLDFVLTDLASQISSWRDNGRGVFVHCVRAESRTPSVAAAYLASRFGIPGSEALQRVKNVLPAAEPNAGFFAALERLWPGGE